MNKALSILEDFLSEKKPVSFRTFVTSPDYCNNSSMYEYWLSNLNKVPDTVSQFLFDGSIGGGKSYAAAYLLCYRVYCLFLNGNPRKAFGLDPDTTIYCLYFSVSLKMAKKSGFDYLYNIFTSCKWFKDNHPVDENLTSSIRIPDLNFEIDYASGQGHQIGLNVWGFILDESNFRKGVGKGLESEYSEVNQLCSQLVDRQFSRFADNNKVNALAIYVSSASYMSSFTETRKQKMKGRKDSFILTSRSYETKRHLFPKEEFEVFIGSGSLAPKIIVDDSEKKLISKNLGMSPELISEFFLKVPINLKSQFETNISLALQNHCGVPTKREGALLSSLKYLYESFDDKAKPVFSSEILEASTKDDTELIEYLLEGNLEYQDRPHSLFLDLSVQNDTGGLSCFRYDGCVEGVPVHTRVFLLQIQPPTAPFQTKISKVQRLIIDLRDYINIVAFSTDQYQSTQLRQEVCDALSIPNIRMSIDSSDQPYIHWMNALVDHRLKGIKSDKLVTEAKEAHHNYYKHRVEKQEGSSDDILQVEVGGFFLSDTIGRDAESADDLLNSLTNIVGTQQYKKFVKRLGYK